MHTHSHKVLQYCMIWNAVIRKCMLVACRLSRNSSPGLQFIAQRRSLRRFHVLPSYCRSMSQASFLLASYWPFYSSLSHLFSFYLPPLSLASSLLLRLLLLLTTSITRLPLFLQIFLIPYPILKVIEGYSLTLPGIDLIQILL
jgi:hypothetical protein